MRTTVTLDSDVAVAVEKVRQNEGIGMSEAVNRLIRVGLSRPAKRNIYQHRSADIGFKVDVTNIGEVVDLLDET